MKYAEFLPDKGRIGFVAPSFGCNIEPYHSSFKHALEVFEKEGYTVKCGPNAFEGSGLGISNTPDKCAKEFNTWYLSPETDVLISCGGGELMCEILDYVDFEAIRSGKAKWFMGYSDNTNLVFLLATLCDTAAIYGPCAPTFGMVPWHPALHDAMAILCGKKQSVHGYDLWEKEGLRTEETPLVPYNVTEPRQLKCGKESGEGYLLLDEHPELEFSMQGRLLGGCLDTLINLCGTKYDQVAAFNERYKEDGIIWFLEACDLNPMSIRRGLWQLAHAGWFDSTKGFLIGRPYCYGDDFLGLDQYKAVTDMLNSYQVPVIMDLDIGHLPPMMPLVSGSYAKVSIKGNDIKIDMEYR